MVVDVPNMLSVCTFLVIGNKGQGDGVPCDDLCFDIAAGEVQFSVLYF